ncbi:MAG: acetate uptake transporter, partial [Acidimicrobiaceae bacterium]|nr:acetate uptake transporter [Acidimicrobiaceae bacterium]
VAPTLRRRGRSEGVARRRRPRQEGWMSAMSSERSVQVVESTPAADPAPLGLAGFALTTFLLSGTNASWIPDLIWVAPAIFYGGLGQFCAGMWEFRNRNVFGATAFSTYGGFWMGLGLYVILAHTTTFLGALTDKNAVNNSLAWFLFAFAVFNTYMLLGSMRVNAAVFMVFLTLEVTEILLVIGFFRLSAGGSPWMLHAGGWAGIVTAAVAWYTSAAGVMNGVSGKVVLPVGRPFVAQTPAPAVA